MEYFEELRARYYGSDAYNFTAGSVVELAAGFFAEGDTATAIRFNEINLEDFPESWQALEGMGDILRVTGDTDAAIEHYERALVLSPNNRSVTQKLGQIR